MSDDAFHEALRLDQAGDHARAARRYEALAAGSCDARVFMAYGCCLRHLGRWKASVDAFQRALALKPAYCEGDTRLALATSLLKAGRNAKAIEQWRIAAAMPPTYPSHAHVPDAARAALAKHAPGKRG